MAILSNQRARREVTVESRSSVQTKPRPIYAAVLVLLALVVVERDDADAEADSHEPEEDEEGTLREALVAVRYAPEPEPEPVFEFELDVDDVDEVEEDELAHASGSVEGNSEPSSSAHPVTVVAQLDSLVIHSASVEVAHDISDEFKYDAQPQPDSQILKRRVGNEASSARSCCAVGSGGTGTSASSARLS